MDRVSHTSVLAYLPSPPQGVWYLGPVPLRAYAICIIIGIVVAVWWGDRRWQARGGRPGDVLDVALWAVPFGLIGGRLYHVATDWYRYFGTDGRGISGALAIWDGGLGIWGAVLVGALGAWIGCRWKGIKLPPFGDAIAPAILLAQAIGRVGNYFNQELYGGPTTLPWGLELYVRRDGAETGISLPDGVSTGVLHSVVHPTFLYEALWNVLVVIVLVLLDRRFRIGHGRLFALYVAGYCAGRFGVELLRTDAATHILGIRINIFTAAIVFLCAALYFVLAPRGRETGLSMYWPRRAEELAAEGELGYVPPALDDDEPEHGPVAVDPGTADLEAEDLDDAEDPDTEDLNAEDLDAEDLEPEDLDREVLDDDILAAGDRAADEADGVGSGADATVYTVVSDPASQVGGIEIREVIASAADTGMVVLAPKTAAESLAESAESDEDAAADPGAAADETSDEDAAVAEDEIAAEDEAGAQDETAAEDEAGAQDGTVDEDETSGTDESETDEPGTDEPEAGESAEPADDQPGTDESADPDVDDTDEHADTEEHADTDEHADADTDSGPAEAVDGDAETVTNPAGVSVVDADDEELADDEFGPLSESRTEEEGSGTKD